MNLQTEDSVLVRDYIAGDEKALEIRVLGRPAAIEE